MDNVTHSVIGIVFGHALSRRGDPLRRGEVWTAVLANNFPDLDVLLRPILGGGKLGSLLHHRGYTHTLLAAIPMGLAAAAIGGLLDRQKPARWLRLMVIGVLGVMLHVFADSWNNYGVHPFSPFRDNWVYGDFIFIAEPAIWLGLLPFAYLQSGKSRARALWLLPGLAILGLTLFLPGIPRLVPLGLTVWTGVMIALQRLTPGWQTPAATLIGVLATFQYGHTLAHAKLEAFLSPVPGERILDLVLTPLPANPLCWQTVALSQATGRPDGDDYIARVGDISLAPSIFPPEVCALRLSPHRTAPLGPVTLPVDASLHWLGQFQGRIDTLRCYAQEDCRVMELLRFARAPFWRQNGDTLIVGDLRYDNEEGIGFSEIEIPWTAADLGAAASGGSAVPPDGSAVSTGGSAVPPGGSAVPPDGSVVPPGGSAVSTGGSASASAASSACQPHQTPPGACLTFSPPWIPPFPPARAF